MIGGTTVNVAVGTPYTDQGATISDNVSSNLAYTVSLDGGAVGNPSTISLDTSVSGTHWIEYRAVDAAGNVGTATRNVIIEAPPAPPAGPPPTP